MPDKIKQIPGKILEIWKKYSKKQRAIILSVTGIVIITLVILVIILNRTQYTELATFKDVNTTKSATDILEAAGIAYRVEDDTMTVSVDVKQKTDATFALASSTLAQDNLFTMDDLFKTDMSTTSSDKKLRLAMFMKSDLESTITKQIGIDECNVLFYPKDNTYSILERQQEIACTVFLITNSEFKKSMAEGIAVGVASALGNPTTDSIRVMDQNNNLLFNGSTDEEEMYLNKTLEHRQTLSNLLTNQIVEFSLMNNFEDATVSLNLDINYDQTETLLEEYIAAEGQEQGLMQTYEKISTENKAASGDIPGTDSNDENEYYIQSNSGGSGSTDELRITYIPSKKTTKITSEWGLFNPENSSMSIVLRRVIPRTEEELETLGLLEGTTFEEYVLQNSEPTQLTLNDEFYTAYSNATGIPVDRIQLIAYQEYSFIPKEETGTNWDLYLKIILFALILGMLIFVIFRGMAPVEVTETEPELLVDTMLALTKENQNLDDIEFSDKSETRRMIEKFVEENPEAVANLLRNWLDDGWN